MQISGTHEVRISKDLTVQINGTHEVRISIRVLQLVTEQHGLTLKGWVRLQSCKPIYFCAKSIILSFLNIIEGKKPISAFIKNMKILFILDQAKL